MGLCTGGLIIGRIFASEIWGAYFREGFFFFLGGGGKLIIGILRYARTRVVLRSVATLGFATDVVTHVVTLAVTAVVSFLVTTAMVL